ncbi:MAG: sugar phosphate nucleotidyltransferase, partial [Gemmatimonadaceae bacterium]|nr:sugar phosphate nucleotidyltransferase [Gemmatimonadaceae bacterium]
TAPLAPPERTLVLTNASLADAVAAAAPELPRAHILAEPQPAGTAAALAWAADEVRRLGGERAVMVCVHADWAVADAEGFRSALTTAADAADAHDALVTVGIVPSRPDVGYGYIQPGPSVAGRVRRVARFVEKPDRATAEQFVADGYLWNSGIFAWTARRFLAELEAHCPEVWPALAACGGDAARFFASARPVAVDVGVLERSDRVLVVPGDFGWDDVGTWAAVHRVRQRDARGNAVHGQAYLVQAKDNVVHAEGRTVVLYGVENLVVVTAPGITMVTTREKAADLKTMLAQLPPRVTERT